MQTTTLTSSSEATRKPLVFRFPVDLEAQYFFTVLLFSNIVAEEVDNIVKENKLDNLQEEDRMLIKAFHDGSLNSEQNTLFLVYYNELIKEIAYEKYPLICTCGLCDKK